MAEKTNPEAELIEWNQVPSIFTNRFVIQSYGDVVRIIFADATVGTKGTPRTAVIMRTSDAVELSQRIIELINPDSAKS